jgi:serine/alanine adding enzyme
MHTSSQAIHIKDTFEISDSLTPAEGWDQYVINHPDSKIYHLREWNDMVKDSFGHETAFISLRQNGAIEGVLPLTIFKSKLWGRFAVSLPFVNYGGPLFSDSDSVSSIFEHLEKFRKENQLSFIELRLEAPAAIRAPCKHHKVKFILELPSSHEDLWTSFKAKLRSQIRRPIKEEMYAEKGRLDLLDDFYRIFTVNMRDLGTPPLPKSFFKDILLRFPANAFIVTVYSRSDEAVAAAFLLKYKNIMEIPWASTIRKYNRFSPNMLLYWESIKLGIEQDCLFFDFGRCSPDSGTYRFKKQWGAEERQLYWYYVLPDTANLPELTPNNPKLRIFVKVWQRIPLFLTTYLGPKIIKNIP